MKVSFDMIPLSDSEELSLLIRRKSYLVSYMNIACDTEMYYGHVDQKLLDILNDVIFSDVSSTESYLNKLEDKLQDTRERKAYSIVFAIKACERDLEKRNKVMSIVLKRLADHVEQQKTPEPA